MQNQHITRLPATPRSKPRREAARRTDVVIIGAGHSGLAMSQRLSGYGIDHVVLERGEVAQRWQHERWDSLALLTPNWMFRLPGDKGICAPAAQDPHGFMHKNQVAHLLGQYASGIDAPLHIHTRVLAVRANSGGYAVQTSAGDWQASAVVLAVGGCNHSHVPGLARQLPAHIRQIPASEYRNSNQVRAGGVLVVGGSATGLQLAAELRHAGHAVTLSVGEHVRMPRTYNGRDIYWWLQQSGILSEDYREVDDLERARRLPSPQLVGQDTGDLNLNRLQDRGIEIVGRFAGLQGSKAQFSGSLANHCQSADLKARRLLTRCDELAQQRGMQLDMSAQDLPPTRINPPRLHVDLTSGEFNTVVWATGFQPDYRFLDLVDVFDRKGRIHHDGGVANAPGLYVLGLNLLRTRASSFIYGCADDTAAVASAVRARLNHAQAG